jgi:hypothetical protein
VVKPLAAARDLALAEFGIRSYIFKAGYRAEQSHDLGADLVQDGG